MTSIDPALRPVQGPSLLPTSSQQQDFEVISPEQWQQAKDAFNDAVDRSNHSNNVEAWPRQVNQGSPPQMMTASPFISSTEFFPPFAPPPQHGSPQQRPFTATCATPSYDPGSTFIQTVGQMPSSQLSNATASAAASPMLTCFDATVRQLMKDGRYAPNQSQPIFRPSTVIPSQNKVYDTSVVNSDNFRVLTSGTTNGERLRRRDVDNRLQRVEEAVQYLGAVSETRLFGMQEEIKSMSARVKSASIEQERIGRGVSEIESLSNKITSKVVDAAGAAKERETIYNRIRAMEESQAKHHKQVMDMLDAMRKEYDTGIKLMLDIAPKSRVKEAKKAVGYNESPETPSKNASTPRPPTAARAIAKKRKSSEEQAATRAPSTRPPAPLTDQSPTPPLDPSSTSSSEKQENETPPQNVKADVRYQHPHYSQLQPQYHAEMRAHLQARSQPQQHPDSHSRPTEQGLQDGHTSFSSLGMAFR